MTHSTQSKAQEHARHGYGRKLDTFDEAFRNVAELPRDVYDALPKFSQEVLGEGDNPTFFEVGNEARETMVFILKLKDGREVLVNTEGFNYCRYTTGFKIV